MNNWTIALCIFLCLGLAAYLPAAEEPPSVACDLNCQRLCLDWSFWKFEECVERGPVAVCLDQYRIRDAACVAQCGCGEIHQAEPAVLRLPVAPMPAAPLAVLAGYTPEDFKVDCGNYGSDFNGCLQRCGEQNNPEFASSCVSKCADGCFEGTPYYIHCFNGCSLKEAQCETNCLITCSISGGGA